ncbi:hypothetical protein RF679_01160 [Undibacterium cyanobacteriorum]|uniref:Glycosyl-4,4'-diaponeurosporenoate acyltransferase n=1 Tax=Undibacterium cyanobacteriorum TaxID=3073561 RepID=A0ABY9RKW3_9BURK|nr:hypothetical protein [Undibacterium sp. 20NA77.5]WMW80905.1 hypothetical protein RF679_01160 [Undibacterium sp. 20NA77.5]
MNILNNAVAMMFLSFIIGVFVDLALRRMAIYESISGRFLFADEKTYERFGVALYRKILLATPLRFFNTQIKIPKNRDLQLLKDIRKHIAAAEVSHWVGFVVMMVATIYAWMNFGPKIGLSFVVLNVLGNLYPCMLQQYNKRRLYQLIAAIERRKS